VISFVPSQCALVWTCVPDLLKIEFSEPSSLNVSVSLEIGLPF
jgi:hypothetical protein